MSKSAGGTKTNSNQASSGTSSVDSQTMGWMQQIFDAARNAGNAGPSPLVTGASGYNTDAMKAGNLGMGALSGDAAATAQLMNPYQSQVINATNAQWDQNDAHTANSVNDMATKAGAFGGSRHGVATGTALAQNNMNRNAQVSGLLNTGYDTTMNRAGQLANMGFAGAGANANLGMGGVGSPEQWLFQMLKGGFMGPTGQTTTGQSSGGSSQLGTQAGFKIPGLG